MSKISFLPLLFLLCVACDRPNPEPEKLDPLYAELQKEQKNVESELKSLSGQLAGFEKELSAVVPQTGQIKYAEKRVYETRARIEKLKQMEQYWKLRIESRQKWAREKYLEAYHRKEPWPNPKEIEEYNVQRRLEAAPRIWDVKQRLEQSKLGIDLKQKPESAPKHED